MIGIGGSIKALVALVVIVTVVGGLYYITGLRADLAVAEENSRKLEEGIKTQQALIEQMKVDIAHIQEVNNQISRQNEDLQKDKETLSTKFSKRDFGALAAEKPSVVEKLVNRGTSNVIRCLELASGAPLNEKELAAKTPTEANRECPSLINPAYSAPN